MKIMIVDDEVIIRTGLAKVIKWNELGLELLEPAASAEEALERIGSEHPNILLTDIRMTGKTGLQLAEEARRLIPELEVIILSGYDDFSYMQQAIRQEVNDYLLKTSRPEEIIKTVLKAKRRIEQKWEAHSHDRFVNNEVRNRLFERWIIEGETGELDLSVLPDYLPRLFGPSGQAEGTLQLLLIAAEGWGETGTSESLLLFAVQNMLNDLLPCETLPYKKRLAVALRAGEGEETSCKRVGECLRKIERLLKCTLYAAAGKPVGSLELLHESFVSADYAFGYKSVIGERIWDYADIMKRRGGKTVCSYEEELELSAILMGDDPIALKSWVQRYVQQQLDDPHMTLESLDAWIQSVAIAAYRWLERVVAATGRADGADTLPAMPIGKPGAAAKEALFQQLYAVMKLYHNRLAESQASHVQRTMAYIEQNLGMDIGLQQVAKHVHLHPNHLSAVFKKETGMTFGDYVTKQKMRRAMDILTVSPAKVSEVAFQVGYEDVKYFSQLFKKFTGKTPSEYRSEAGSAPGHE